VADANKKFPVKVSFVWEEVDCDEVQATAAISRMMQAGIIDAVIGPDCEASCENSASFTAVQNIAQISYSCSSDLLSDKTKYPTVAPLPLPLSALAPLLPCRAIVHVLLGWVHRSMRSLSAQCMLWRCSRNSVGV
jgi:ABC-type branched-subunit amino acid transport system substrate-binding protein